MWEIPTNNQFILDKERNICSVSIQCSDLRVGRMTISKRTGQRDNGAAPPRTGCEDRRGHRSCVGFDRNISLKGEGPVGLPLKIVRK